ncbi:MAG: long-chain fatty acid transporter [Rhodocyclaceae bacterium]|jgi:long-chain fatty acid transport protein|uniref:Long-chain fatty acid transporter n=1 Tax=Candidatus Desulfobacillus denitrificans TaxID=2608985 RepID=A0A809SBI8_9PROT|nr:outer membrane protein transport protein [Rhodocyclaceae bacterium]BBO21604.1 long-chain fatty acid transporter [Candidatus Desulfobacillus denitrificans]GIK46439.1 MAG: long-chain fatty acid transporter [Betaproteobacteria bacterium]GJQ55974.1 MAG: long-chain fatty acid transporter [Rhodocyclaceae bacterium]
MKLKQLAGILGAMALAAPGMALATNGYFSHGYGMKSKGMAGVGIALPQDAMAAATNPAGMAFVGDRLDVGVDWFRPIRDTEIVSPFGVIPGLTGDFSGNGKKNFLVPEFGYNKMLGWNMALGVNVYGNGGMNTTYDNGPAPFGGGIPLFNGGTGQRTGVNLEQLFIAPTFAYKINKNHAVGVSLNLAYQRFRADGLGGFAPFSMSPTNFSDRGVDSSTGWGIKLGYTGNLTDAVTVGATYQSRTRMGKFGKYKGLFAEQGDFDIPETYGIGIAVKATPKLTVAADIQHISYGSIDSISNRMPGFPPMCLMMGTCPLGADNGPGFGWRDMTVFKLGVSYAWSDSLTLRAGVSTTNQPIPKSQTLFNMVAPGVIENHLTLGATWAVSPASELTVAYMHAFSKKVKGSNSFVMAPPGMAEANLKMYEDSLGIAYGLKF